MRAEKGKGPNRTENTLNIRSWSLERGASFYRIRCAAAFFHSMRMDGKERPRAFSGKGKT